MTNARDTIESLYRNPLPSTRTGALYNAFSYPTKISPEAVAIFIATHTKPGSLVLDTFGGSGTTGLATLLCDRPTDGMKRMAASLGVQPEWGPRTAHIYEVGTLGSFVAETLCNPPDPETFERAARELLTQAKSTLGWMYTIQGPDGQEGSLRHNIWSEVLVCPYCAMETSYWEAVVRREPLRLEESFMCTSCGKQISVAKCERATETIIDEFIGQRVERRKRVLVQVYGQSGKYKWKRPPLDHDKSLFASCDKVPLPLSSPKEEIVWGDLHRAGYHTGISHLHHFYTRRNFLCLSTLWESVDGFSSDVQNALRLLILSYNATHSTQMTRVVVKKGQSDFVLTGAQSGVLYISGLPVEKNVFEGISRKISTIRHAFESVHRSKSKVIVKNQSSEQLDLPNSIVDYVFTDPPFGGYIPYAEVNQINELWLGRTTDRSKEVIISHAQDKDVQRYGEMMSAVLDELARVMKPGGLASIVFHSSRSDVWNALVKAYTDAGLSVKAASVLDKLQASFKQVVSEISVKGDPLLLLTKQRGGTANNEDPDRIVQEILSHPTEHDAKRLYSMYLAQCLERGADISIGAREFYTRAKKALEATNELVR